MLPVSDEKCHCKKRSIAIVRPFRPNVAEMAIYRPLLSEFNITFYYTGMDPVRCRKELDDLGLHAMVAKRYRGYTDYFRSTLIQRAVDYKIGLGSLMLSHLNDVLRHTIINLVDPIYAHVNQVVTRMRPKQKLVLMRWENIDGRYEKIWRAAQTWQRAFRRADRVICVSRAALHTLRLPSGAACQIDLVYPGIALPCGDRHPNHTNAILFVGRPQWAKGLSHLMSAFSILLSHFRTDAELWIVGVPDADLRPTLSRLGIEARTRVFGKLPHEEVRTKMAAASAFCFPSLVSPTWTEQYGFAMVEAMAHGLPVVAFNSGSIREICGPDGEYASTGNAYELAEAIAHVVGAPDRGQARGERLRQRVETMFDAERQGRALLSIYNGLSETCASHIPKASV